MPFLRANDKIFVAGHRGLVGSALVDSLNRRGYSHLLTAGREELDLSNWFEVSNYFAKHRPDVVFLAAAKVGGILANSSYQADFIYQNLLIQNNVIWSAHQNDVRRLIFLGSSCIYPKYAPQPMPETCLLSGELEATNRAYALAKIAGLELVQSLRNQYHRDYFSVMPTNLYGPRDNFDPELSHVLPALIRKFSIAKEQGQAAVTLWGSGEPKREFMHSADCADAIIYVAETLSNSDLAASSIGKSNWSHINIGTGQEVSIADLARLIAKFVNYTGEIQLDRSKPDGSPRKLLDTTFLHSLGWKPKLSLEEGIRSTIAWFVSQR